MKKPKPPQVPLSGIFDESIVDIVQEFINHMTAATKGAVEVDIDPSGNVDIYFEAYEHKISKRPEINMDILFRGDYIDGLYE